MKIACLPALRSSVPLSSPTPLLPLPSREGKKETSPQSSPCKGEGEKETSPQSSPCKGEGEIYAKSRSQIKKLRSPPPHPVLRTTFSHTGEKEETGSSRFTLHLKQNSRVG